MTGQVVLITGCSSGIGRNLAERLARAGYRVVATARRPETLADLPVAHRTALDVEEPESVARAVQETIERFGQVDVLVNNAGYAQFGALEEVPEELVARSFAVNLHGPLRLIRAVLPQMRARGAGRIINLSSMSGRVVLPVWGAYGAAKFALEGMSDALRRELAPFGIQVVLIEPASVRTEFAPTARAQAMGVMANPGSTYRDLYRRMEQFLERSYRSAPGPEVVSQVVQRAIEAQRPRARYPVAGVAERLLPWLGDAMLDRLIARLL